ncbi:DUF2231 domain-containing protein [Paractinoplanes hotanensis]|uniref:DUF2231 domain-containing protein n=1 Tax=Paractinoplanes hotanensis TaxID=2906497 RepID=A0ABT0YEA1_9ACTN|nr:DUF2231 domain-containing protein [Actinoplanes hotanensis]MCM4084385.1 hypothetical protein [Actinoplanes hotanensis]
MSTVNGLPAHLLLVHAVVVLLPLSALLLIATVVRPAARRRFAGANVVLSLLVVVLVPLTTSAGEWLEQRVPSSDLVHRHAELGDTAILYALPIAVLALLVWWRERETAGEGSARRTYLAPTSSAVTGVIAAVAVVVAAAGVYGTYRIGDSGARAAWTGTFDVTATSPRAEHP